MNRSRKGSSGGDTLVNYNDTLVDVFGDKEKRIHGELKDDPLYRQFQQKFREINQVSERKNIPAGEALQLIVLQFGYSLEDIQFGRLDEVKDFLEKNIDLRYAFINPELHAFLLRCNYYEKSRTNIAPKAMLAGYCSTVLAMMDKKCTNKQFIEFGVEVSKL
jgi:hypothetical protein